MGRFSDPLSNIQIYKTYRIEIFRKLLLYKHNSKPSSALHTSTCETRNVWPFLEAQLIFYAFLYHRTQLLHLLHQKHTSQAPLCIICAGGIPRLCSRTDMYRSQTLWSWSYKHLSETTFVSVCRLIVFVTQPHFTEQAREKSGAGRKASAFRAWVPGPAVPTKSA